MIETLEIHNFKSIKDLTLPCKRFNVFVGEPNTGKSNILEALGLVSFVGAKRPDYAPKLDGFVRHERLSHLFYDEEVSETVSIRADEITLVLDYDRGQFGGMVSRCTDREHGDTLASLTGSGSTINIQPYPDNYIAGSLDPTGVKFYRFVVGKDFVDAHHNFLLPPSGANLPSLLVQNRELRNAVNLPFIVRDLRLGLRPQENKIEVVKSVDDIIISYPYSLASETLQRLTFYTAALETNRDSVLVFEEPEAHSFPNDTKLLAEQIALDENNNQYFIVTHNPGFLMPLLCKAPSDGIAINIVYDEDYQTKVKEIPPSELPELFELDVFFNLERYLEP